MSNKHLQYKYGLQELPYDERDFQLGKVSSPISLSELPRVYALQKPAIKDQKGSDFCSAFASCYASEYQEDQEFEPSWSFAVSKKISGDPEKWGQSLRSACKAHTKYGALPTIMSPYSLENKKTDFLRYFKNWPEDLLQDAEPYKKQSYISAKEGAYDVFDNIRVAMWQANENRAVIIGLQWGWGSDAKVIKKPKQGYGHAVAVIGWTHIKDEPYLVIVNSWGMEAGDNGVHYLSREVINENVSRYGAYFFTDIPKDVVKYHNDWKLDLNWSVLKKWWEIIKKIFHVKS